MRRLLLAIALAGAASGAAAAAFDCAKAASTVERTICGDPALSALDERLATLYAARRSQDKSATATQRTWLKEVRDKCGTAACLDTAYKTRIQALEAAPSPGAACAVGEGALVGDWRNVNPAGGEFEELHFGPAGESPNFVSWVRHAPYVTGTWSLRDCKVHVAGTGEATDFDFSVEAAKDGQLRLKDVADADDVLILSRVRK
jgi:uncharacterized protein